MKHKEFVQKFKSQSISTSEKKKLFLAISICKKLFFDYQTFSSKNNWGNSDLLLDAISLAENFQPADVPKVKEILPLIHKNCPDSEDFENASYAINAASATYETLEFLLDRNDEHIYNVGTYLTDTVDFKIQEENELTEDQIDNHPLMLEARHYLIVSTK